MSGYFHVSTDLELLGAVSNRDTLCSKGREIADNFAVHILRWQSPGTFPILRPHGDILRFSSIKIGSSCDSGDGMRQRSQWRSHGSFVLKTRDSVPTTATE